MDDADEPFVLSAWIKSHRDMMRRQLAPKESLDEYRQRVLRIINVCRPVVAFSSTDLATLLGFACGNSERLEFVYVPRDMRCMGVGERLIRQVMGGYPERIVCGHPWPFKSRRFVYEAERSAA